MKRQSTTFKNLANVGPTINVLAVLTYTHTVNCRPSS